MLQSWVDVVIAGNREEPLLEVPRGWLREGDSVWVEEDGRLAIRELEIAWRREDSVLVAGGLDEDDNVVTSAIATPVGRNAFRYSDAPEEIIRRTRRASTKPASGRWCRRCGDCDRYCGDSTAISVFTEFAMKHPACAS